MNILRGVLRMQRLDRNDKRLADVSDVAAGHELDWFVFELKQLKFSSRVTWHLTVQYEGAKEIPDREVPELAGHPSIRRASSSSQTPEKAEIRPQSATTCFNPGYG